MEVEEIITNLIQLIRIKEGFFISKEVWNRNGEDQNIKPRNKLKIHENQISTIQRSPRFGPLASHFRDFIEPVGGAFAPPICRLFPVSFSAINTAFLEAERDEN